MESSFKLVEVDAGAEDIPIELDPEPMNCSNENDDIFYKPYKSTESTIKNQIALEVRDHWKFDEVTFYDDPDLFLQPPNYKAVIDEMMKAMRTRLKGHPVATESFFKDFEAAWKKNFYALKRTMENPVSDKMEKEASTSSVGTESSTVVTVEPTPPVPHAIIQLDEQDQVPIVTKEKLPVLDELSVKASGTCEPRPIELDDSDEDGEGLIDVPSSPIRRNTGDAKVMSDDNDDDEDMPGIESEMEANAEGDNDKYPVIDSGDDIPNCDENFTTSNSLSAIMLKLDKGQDPWKAYLYNGVFRINGKEYVFKRAQGNVRFFESQSDQ